MTSQITDKITYKGELYNLVGMKGEGLFTAQDFGIKPYITSMGARLINTSCRRGYVMEYIFINDQLILNEMMLVYSDNPLKINEVEPQSGHSIFQYCYKNLNLKIKFTGKLLLAKKFIEPKYIDKGFQRSMAFETVIEITMENGDLISIKDLSEKIGEYRMQFNGPKKNSLREKILEEHKRIQDKGIVSSLREFKRIQAEGDAFPPPPPPKDIEEWINQPFPPDSPWYGI